MSKQPNATAWSSYPSEKNAAGEKRAGRVRTNEGRVEKLHEVKKELLPYPEIVRPGKWQITDSYKWKRMSGATNIRDKKMVVPTSEAGRAIVLHEMGHARWSPEEPKKMRSVPTIFNAVEDARVNHGIEHLGLGLKWGEEIQKEVAKHIQMDLKNKDYGMALLRGIAAIGTDLEQPISELLSILPTRWAKAGPELMLRVRKGMESSRARSKADVATTTALYSMTKKVASRLAELEWEDKEEEAAEAAAAKKPKLGKAKKDSDGNPTNKAPLGKGAIRAKDHERPKFERPKIKQWKPKTRDGSSTKVFKGSSIEYKPFKKIGTTGSDTETWVPSLAETDFVREKVKDGQSLAKLYITRPPLCVEQIGVIRRMAGAPTACDEGTVIRRPDRLLIDRAIFAKRRKRMGATILVDASGSMDITPEEIEKVVIAAGCMATVAMYCGSGKKGELRIVAEGTSRCSDEDMAPRYGGNVVDLQSLQWLSRMPEPRLWMSDGYVTGSGDVGSDEILRACEKVNSYHRITRFWNAEEIIRHLEMF